MADTPHKSTGIRGILNTSIAYKTFQYVIGDYKLYKRILQMLPSLENKTVVGIACGNGALLEYLPRSVQYIGYDFNPDYIKKAESKYSGRNARFFVADINSNPDLPLADVAFAIGVLHHLTDSTCLNFM